MAKTKKQLAIEKVEHEKSLEEILEEINYNIANLASEIRKENEVNQDRLEQINASCTENLNKLNRMMLELKGVIAISRPSARKNEWYNT